MQNAQASIRIEPAVKSQTPLILYFIRQLAEYEKLLDNVTADEARIEESLFGENPSAEVLIAHLGDQPAGFAIYFSTYSTFVGRPGIYLEDLFVEPKFRGYGVGKALLAHLAKLVQRARRSAVGMVGAQLERAGDSVLQRIGCDGTRCLDDVPRHR